MKSIDKIPTSKIQRASKLVSTGAKIGVNYLKYYGEKLVGSEDKAKSKLDESNASDIYDSLKSMKGSALKMAQMMSMDKTMLPQAYVEKFSLSQFSVPPLSPALVKKTFKRYFGKDTEELFDTFNYNAINAASIGQVHQAELNGKKLAVKIQYPGVAESIGSDLAMVKPIALRMLNIKGKDADRYFHEVEEKLMEETDYALELQQSISVSEACRHIPNLLFPNYHKELSNDKILTMDWMEGIQISEFAAKNTSAEKANKVGQALWDFYMYQIHVVKKVHADPHPGNFMVTADDQLIAIDFGCMKEVPEDFYLPYFELTKPEILNDPVAFEKQLYALEILKTTDSPEETKFFSGVFKELLGLFALPFYSEEFDFSDPDFFNQIANMAEKYSKDDSLRKVDAGRGSKHFIYINRAFFGLYSLMNELNANKIIVNNYKAIEN
ncbi:ABC1 kinase family protein [Brumimicrobium oceani]|uniref:ABC transporter n=1 Tax=Brumimicrobium oceani TaxID=2100725 RepID=A0A2U2XDX8_9FLAO|nr:AarF/ABC1/UbiB kinase family protein [Brumimicrobium oceani]PWH86009.1 ABC transporter [Brumimicrobium oceani]